MEDDKRCSSGLRPRRRVMGIRQFEDPLTTSRCKSSADEVPDCRGHGLVLRHGYDIPQSGRQGQVVLCRSARVECPHVSTSCCLDTGQSGKRSMRGYRRPPARLAGGRSVASSRRRRVALLEPRGRRRYRSHSAPVHAFSVSWHRSSWHRATLSKLCAGLPGHSPPILAPQVAGRSDSERGAT